MIREIFNEIGTESSTKQKMVILGKYKDNQLLKDVLYLANSPRIKFFIKKIPVYTNNSVPSLTLSESVVMLKDIYERKVTGNDAINFLKDILEKSSVDDSYIIERIIEKDCKIGIDGNINKVIPNLVEECGYMGCVPFDGKFVYNILLSNKVNFSQEKMDGRYANVIIRNGEVEMTSRQGEPTILTGSKLLDNLSKLSDCVLNGELVMDTPDGSIMDRYTSNGLIASIIDINKKRGERTEAETNKKIRAFEDNHMPFNQALNLIRFTAWDTLTVDEFYDLKSIVPYYIRFSNLADMLSEVNLEMISIVETRMVNNKDEVISHFEEILLRGGEGTILKSYDGLWKNGKPVTQCKLKKEVELDLKIVGFNYGTGKNKELISSLNCESSDGLLKTSPTGISREMMLHITENQGELLNTVVAVKCSGLSQDSTGNYSLLHPVFKSLRIGEKNIANSLSECIEINKSSQFV